MTKEESLEKTRKKLIFRSWHRGTREMDILMGRFADSHVPDFDAEALAHYEDLLQENDPDLYNWYTGKEPAPDSAKSDVLTLFMKYRVPAHE